MERYGLKEMNILFDKLCKYKGGLLRSGCFFTLLLVTVLMPASVDAGITIQFDYTYDTNGFFAEGTEARETLEWVGKFYSCLLDDDLLAINSLGSNNYTAKFWQPNMMDDPETTESEGIASISGFDVSADTIKVYAGAQAMDGVSTLAWSGPGWYSVTGTNYFQKSSISRGEGSGAIADVQGTTAYEAGIWGGSVSVNTNYNWNEDHSLLAVYGEFDLVSVLLHELCHTLGLGTLDSWDNLVSGTTFTGTESTAANSGVAPTLQSSEDTAHWSTSTPDSTVWGTGDAQRTIMEPYISSGADLWTTTLDIAALDDIGWDINPVDTWTGGSGSAFSATSSWSTGVSPGWRDSVRFDSSSTQSVAFTQDAQIMQAAFVSGQTTWALAGHTVQTDLLWATGSGTSLQVQGGTLQIAVMATVDSGCSVTVDSAGQIELLDSTFNGNLTVDAGGELIGNGVIAGTLYHHADGTVSPGGNGQVGSFTLTNYTQADDALLEIDIVSLEDFDSLVVDNNISLAGDLVINLDPTFTLNLGDTFQILSCNGTLSGEFDSLLGDVSYGDLELTAMYNETSGTVSLVALAATVLVPGDANRDGKVDGSDVTILAGNWQAGVDGSGGVTWEMGDFNSDGKVDGSDVTILAGNWQAGVETTASAVPEPSMLGLLLLLAGSVLASRGYSKSKSTT